MATRTKSPSKKHPAPPAGHHPEHCNSRHDSPHEVHERIEHLEHHIHKLLNTVKEMTMKFDEALSKINSSIDTLGTRVGVLEQGQGTLTPAQEQTVTDTVARLDGLAQPAPQP